MLFSTSRLLRLPRLRVVLCLMLVVVPLLSLPLWAATQERYVVNLLSMKQAIDLDKVNNLSSVQGRYQLILYKKPLDTATVSVLSVGYFSSLNEARKIAVELDSDFKGAYATRFLDSYSVQKTIEAGAGASVSSAKTVAKTIERAGATSLSDERLEQIMESARAAIKSGDNPKAIQLFSAVLSVPENQYSIEALELLGLARERNDQYNHAVNIYNKYISLYPESDGIRRVKQRLAVLTTAEQRVDTSIARKDTPSRERPWETSGSLSQSYRNNNGEDSELYTYFDVGSRKRSDDTDINLQFSGNRTSPLTGDNDTDFQISELYSDINFLNNGMSTQIGRMRSRSGGLYSRLDGLMVTYDDLQTTKYNAFFGLPVDSAREFLFASESEKRVYGVNTDMLFFDESLDINTYLVEQRNDGLLDRQAVGVEARYFRSDLSVFGLYDYDISYDQTSIFLLTGNWITAGDLTLFFNVDYRTSPLLLTGNAVIGQTETDPGTLAATLGEDAMRQLAEDRTSISRLLSMGVSWPMSQATTIRADVTASTISSTPDSGGVVGTPETGPDYYYSLQFVTTNYFDLQDTSILQFQYADTETSKKVSTLVSTRVPVAEKLLVTPRATVSFTDLASGQDRAELRTSLRADYRYSRNLNMDIELGVDFSNIEQPNDNSKLTNYYTILEYYWLF